MNKVYIVNKYYNLEIELNFIDKNFILDNIDYKFELLDNVLKIYWLSNEFEEYYTENSYIYYSDKSLKNKIRLIYLIHNIWYDQAIIDYDNNILKRIKYSSEKGTINTINNILYIKWEKWNPEEFIELDDYTYLHNSLNLKINNNNDMDNNNNDMDNNNNDMDNNNNIDNNNDMNNNDIDNNNNNDMNNNIYTITNNIYTITNTKIYIFIHICCIENWKDIFNDQIRKIKESGLYDIVIKINLCILGNINIINDEIFNDDKFNIIYVDSRIYLYEIMTINSIKSFCERMNEEVYILYIHTKGVRRAGNDIIIKSWRNMMEYFLIYKFRDCLNGLETLNYDTLGNNILNSRCVDKKYANINQQHNHNLHYSGNFWWSKKSYIDKLEYIDLNLSKTADFTRFKAENWILSNYPETNIGIAFQDNTNLHPYYRYVFDYYKKMKFYIKKYYE